jgi:hypothetical protein
MMETIKMTVRNLTSPEASQRIKSAVKKVHKGRWIR